MNDLIFPHTAIAFAPVGVSLKFGKICLTRSTSYVAIVMLRSFFNRKTSRTGYRIFRRGWQTRGLSSFTYVRTYPCSLHPPLLNSLYSSLISGCRILTHLQVFDLCGFSPPQKMGLCPRNTERVGFEPTVGYPTRLFESRTLNHSDTSPKV